MIQALELAEAAHAGVERGLLRGPLARIGADLDDLPVADVGVDHAAPAAVVAAGAGDDGLARRGGRPGRFIADGLGHRGSREITAGWGKGQSARLGRHGDPGRDRGRRSHGTQRRVPPAPRRSRHARHGAGARPRGRRRLRRQRGRRAGDGARPRGAGARAREPRALARTRSRAGGADRYRRSGGLRLALDDDGVAAGAGLGRGAARGRRAGRAGGRGRRARSRPASPPAAWAASTRRSTARPRPARRRRSPHAARRLGARVEEGVAVSALVVERGRVVGVERGDGAREAVRRGIVAAGAWSAALLGGARRDAADRDAPAPDAAHRRRARPRSGRCWAPSTAGSA